MLSLKKPFVIVIEADWVKIGDCNGPRDNFLDFASSERWNMNLGILGRWTERRFSFCLGNKLKTLILFILLINSFEFGDIGDEIDIGVICGDNELGDNVGDIVGDRDGERDWELLCGNITSSSREMLLNNFVCGGVSVNMITRLLLGYS